MMKAAPVLPDLSAYTLHRTVETADLDGAAVPRLSAEFLHLPMGDRTASVGRYRYDGAFGWTTSVLARPSHSKTLSPSHRP